MENKLNHAMELINKQKEDIAKRKNNILVAETRREENQKALEADKAKVKQLGYDPDKITEVVATMQNELNNLGNELDTIIEELELMQFK